MLHSGIKRKGAEAPFLTKKWPKPLFLQKRAEAPFLTKEGRSPFSYKPARFARYAARVREYSSTACVPLFCTLAIWLDAKPVTAP